VLVRIALVTVLLLSAAACSSTSEFAVEFTVTNLPEAELSQVDGGCTETATPPCIFGAFTVTGEAVDEGIVCPAGNVWFVDNETPDGDPLTHEQIAAQVDAGEIFPIVNVHDYECTDGSGVIDLKTTINFDPAIMDMDSATWSVDSGTGAFANLTGSGEVSRRSDVAEVLTGTVSSD
jgi:hypothetical protein